MDKKLYWLYYGERVLTGILMPIGGTAREAKRKAIDMHKRVPLCAGTGFAPFEWERMLSNAEVRL